MNTIYYLLAIVFAISQRSHAGFPIAFVNDYAPYAAYPGYYPYAAPVPIAHAPLPAYTSLYPYSVPVHYPHKELHNVAGAVERENELLTDVSIRFPVRARKLAAMKAARKNL
ncbi:hypothetical protein Y032_0040g332 [Ancylostoma ceylanicum]|uniref:Uncharacterized protein n=1 Tax=Ancylostoma ceylanicum TaxID=53326 RepID=A0A016UIK7_9BILA|nr:hypothetical protein Y032_0040g332 [Ancylostoma ceylanicum]